MKPSCTCIILFLEVMSRRVTVLCVSAVRKSFRLDIQCIGTSLVQHQQKKEERLGVGGLGRGGVGVGVGGRGRLGKNCGG